MTKTTGQSLVVASQITMPSGELSTTRRQASADQLFMSGCSPASRVRAGAADMRGQQVPGARPLGQGLEGGVGGGPGTAVQAHQAQARGRLRFALELVQTAR